MIAAPQRSFTASHEIGSQFAVHRSVQGWYLFTQWFTARKVW